MNRTSRIKALIENTIIDILKEKPIESITISELCKKANIHRTSFYYYYNNVVEVLYELESKNITNIVERYFRIKDHDNDFVISLLTFIKNSSFSQFAKNHFDEYSQKIRNNVINHLNSTIILDKLSIFRIECSIDFSIIIIKNWIESHYELSESDIAQLIIDCNPTI